jgi:hypothetical protein
MLFLVTDVFLSEFNTNNSKLFTIYITKINIYKEANGNICSDLNISSQESLLAAPTIIPTTLFCSLNTWTLLVELPQKIKP